MQLTYVFECPNLFGRYEMRAIHKAKIKMMGLDHEKSVSRTVVEVEMTDAKNESCSKPLGSNIGRDEGVTMF